MRLGLRQATMDDIAAQAGISKVILYRFFASKDELISTLLDGVVARVLAHFDRPWAGLEDDLTHALGIVREDKNAFLVLVRHAQYDPTFGHYFQTVREASMRRTARIAEMRWTGLTDPRLRAISTEALTGFIFETITRWVETAAESEDPVFLRWALETIPGLYAAWTKGPVDA